MKSLLTILFLCSYILSKAQSDGIVVPYNTMVSLILTEELKEGKNKVGTPTKFAVAEDVKINDEIAIAKNAPVTGTVTISKRGELRVEMSDVIAVDGSHLKLADCWSFTTAAQNQKSRGAMFVKGFRKNCYTPEKYIVKRTAGKF